MTKLILIDARLYGLENSGIGRYLINLIKELIVLDKNNKYILLLREKYFNELKLPRNWKKVLVDIRHYTLKEQLKIPQIISKEAPDLVHFPHINFPIFYKGKYVITVHDLTMQRQGSNASDLPLPLYYLKRLPFLLSAVKAVRNAGMIIVPSIEVKNDVVNYYSINSNKVKVAYEGVSFPTAYHSQRISAKKILDNYGISEKQYFLYVGNAYPHKNLDFAIKAFNKLNSQSKFNTNFVIAGSGGVFKDRLEKNIKDAGAQKLVKLLGYIPDEELPALYKNSIAFIYPSISEGFGLQGLETMAAETLLLASDIPVFKEIYREQAMYFDPKNEDSLVEAMGNAIKLPQKERSKIINSSKEYIKRFSWHDMAKDTLEVYQQVLSEK